MSWILIVDDEPRTHRLIARVLERNGYLTDVATDGPQALSAMAAKPYGLVLLDLLLPGLDGYEVLRRAMAEDPARRVLVLSGVNEVESKVRCLQMGAVDYLPKPFALAELVVRVNVRMREREAHPADRWLVAGDARLDLQRRELVVGEREVSLSHKEFVLLGHLMRHAGEVCTRDDLLAGVWGYSHDPGSNVVDVCVKRLRSKTEPGLIETVRNVGYCFNAT